MNPEDISLAVLQQEIHRKCIRACVLLIRKPHTKKNAVIVWEGQQR